MRRRAENDGGLRAERDARVSVGFKINLATELLKSVVHKSAAAGAEESILLTGC